MGYFSKNQRSEWKNLQQRNQILEADLYKWLVQKKTKQIVTLQNFVLILKYNLAKNRPYFFCYSTPYIVSFLNALKPLHIIVSFHLFLKKNEGVQNGVLLVFLPAEKLGKCQIKFFVQNKRFYYITYKQIQYWLVNSKNIVIFNTVEGILPHKELLKKKIGGNLLCSLL